MAILKSYLLVLLYVLQLCLQVPTLKIFFVSSISMIVFVLLYSLVFGLMAGLTFMIPMRICNDYFPNKQTYVNGFILIGTGLGSVVFGVFSINYVNPEQVNPIDGFYIDPEIR